MLATGIAALCLLGFAASARAATVTVTNANDSGAGSLRAAVAAAGAGDTIDFDPGLNGQTIDLTSGAIAIDKSLTISGPGAAQLTIDADHNSQIFTVTAGPLSISGLTLANGAAPRDGGAIYYWAAGGLTVSDCAFIGNTAGGAGGADNGSGRGEGGAIYVSWQAQSPSISISDSAFTANTAGGDGGGGSLSGRGEGGAIADYGGGTLTITGTTFTANTVGGARSSGLGSGRGFGGAISVLGGGTLGIADSTFAANVVGGQAGGSGGAVFAWNRSLTVSGSTFAANAVGEDGGGGQGGAISAAGLTSLNLSTSISNSTLVGNVAGGGGAIGRGGAIEVTDMSSMTLRSVTIAGNAVGAGGTGAGINAAADAISHPATVTARATIVSGNTGAANCDAPVASSAFSLEGPSAGDVSCGFDLPSADPLLEPLDDNGGPTETMALPPASPAVDAVPAAHCPTSVDQRGEPRPDNGKAVCDVGAYELQDPPVAPAITSAAAAAFEVGKAGSFTVTATGLPVPALSLAAGELPAGVAFTDNGNGTATIAGTPALGAEGSHPVTIEASNGVSPDATQGFTLTVQAPPAIAILTISLPAGIAGTPYEAEVKASGGTPPYRYSATGLPPGLSIDPDTGRISGTPMTAVCVRWPCPQPSADYAVTVTVADSIGVQASKPLTLALSGMEIAEVGPGERGPGPRRPPVVTKLRQSQPVWKMGRGAGRGTTFSFELNVEAAVRLVFTRHLAGRKQGGSCVAETRRNRKRKACRRTVRAGTLSFSGRPGANKVAFNGRVARANQLRPGRYTLTVTAAADRRRSAPASLSFTIAK